MEVDSGCVDWEDDVPQCEFLFAVEPDKDYGLTMDVGLIYVHLLQSVEEDDVGGRAIVNKYSLDPTVGYEQRDD